MLNGIGFMLTGIMLLLVGIFLLLIGAGGVAVFFAIAGVEPVCGLALCCQIKFGITFADFCCSETVQPLCEQR